MDMFSNGDDRYAYLEDLIAMGKKIWCNVFGRLLGEPPNILLPCHFFLQTKTGTSFWEKELPKKKNRIM